ncbi:MAG: protein phosphatase 2C domain-containing protein [Clostridiales bacterium]|jgi:protein phosphatase|nr:protein phosphatase 2C domain-containing protein [Clostridiales bacterium]
MHYYSITNKGVLDNNQDAITIMRAAYQADDHTETSSASDVNSLFAVFDGVGGTAQGKQASYLAAKIFSRTFSPISEDEIIEVIDIANCAINWKYNRKEVLAATTVAGVAFSADKTFVFNVGDSKVFTINNGYFEEKSTSDDIASTINRLEDSYQYDSISKSPLMQYLGNPDGISQVHIVQLARPKQLFICTDGVTDLLDIDALEEILSGAGENCGVFSEMVKQQLLGKGARDNFSLIILDLSEVC